jgi:hypothetical protein
VQLACSLRRLFGMRGNSIKCLLLWASLVLLGCTNAQAKDEHPWIGIANASVFPQRLLDHRKNHGWSSLRTSLFIDAKDAYERRLPVAERLLYTFLWVDILYEKESDYVTEWVEKMGQAKRLHANMPKNIPFLDGAVGDRLSDNLFKYFFSKGDLLRATYNQRDPSDL